MTKINSITPSAPIVASSVAIGFIALSLLVFVLHEARAIIIPFVIAVFVWYLINAMARGIGYLSIGGLALPRFARFTLAIIALCAMLVGIGTLISRNIADVIQAAPHYQENFQPIIQQVMVWLELSHQPTFEEIREYLDLGKVITVLAQSFTGIAGKMLVVIFYTGFLLYEQKYFNRKIINMISHQKTEDHVRAIIHKIDVRIQRYIGIKALVSLIDSTITFFILSAFGVDFAEFWGLMAFFLHFIPYAGSFIAISVPSIISLIQFGDPTIFGLVMGSLCLSHAFLGHVLDPYLMGNNLNLSPIFIISSLAMWGMVWGIPGMFLAVPILAIITIILSQFPNTRPIAILLSKNGVLKDS
jgi:predicted PurR-regulated permease PerM